MEEETREDQPVAQAPVAVEERKINPPIIVVLLIVILLIGVGGVYAGMQIGKKQAAGGLLTKITSIPIPQPTETPASDETADWKTYKNEKYGVEFKYPQEYLLDEASSEIKVNAPLSKCNPALIFNNYEYDELREIYISIKKRPGLLEEVLLEEGGKEYGWIEANFNERKAYLVSSGAEAITPLERLLIEKGRKEVLDVNIYVFGSDDSGKCSPKLNFAKANNTKKLILSTFNFLE